MNGAKPSCHARDLLAKPLAHERRLDRAAVEQDGIDARAIP